MTATLALSTNLLEHPFLWVADATLHASVLIVFILVLQVILRDRLTPRWRYALWLLVAARLCLPMSIESPASAFNLLPTWDVASVTEPARDAAIEASHVAAVAGADDDVGTFDSIDANGGTAIDTTPPLRDQYARAAPIVALPMPAYWLTIAAAAWCIGVTVMVITMLIGGRRWAQVAQRSRPAPERVLALRNEAAAQIGARRVVDVRISDGAAAPCLVGAIRPVIVLPQQMANALSTFELRCVLMHELAHDRQRDVLVNWLLAGLIALHWFNPLVWIAVRRLRSERELLRDAMVLERLESRQRSGYARLLLTLAELLGRGSVSIPSPVAATMSVRRSDLHRRMQMIMNHSTRGRSATRIGGVLIALLAATTLTSAMGPDERATAPPDDRDGLEVRVIPLKNTRAEQIATVINDVLSGKVSQPDIDIPDDLGEVAVVSDARTNALIVAAERAGHVTIDRLIELLDVTPRQVSNGNWPDEIVIVHDGPPITLALRLLEVPHDRFARRIRDLVDERVETERGHTMRFAALDRDAATKLFDVLVRDDASRVVTSPKVLLSGNGSAHLRIGGSRTLTLPRHELPKFQETIDALDGMSLQLNASWDEAEQRTSIGVRGRYTEFADGDDMLRVREAVLDVMRSVAQDTVLLVAVPFESRDLTAVRITEDPLSDRVVREIVKTDVEAAERSWIIALIEPSVVDKAD